MIKSNSLVTKSKKSINDGLVREFLLAGKDETFQKLCHRLKTDDKILMKYTSKLQDTCEDLKRCSKCKNLDKCTNDIEGHVYYPKRVEDHLEFYYKPCKYFKNQKEEATTTFFETPNVLKTASLSDLISEKERNEILKYIKDFLKKKINNEPVKGLYLSGSFGSGKSYILSALLNELSNKGFHTVNVYYPALLKELKSLFNDDTYDEVFDEIIKCDCLLLDDIGAENNSNWARDEVLATILQYRMDNNLTTFFTSNFTIDELESVLSETSKGTDEIKARRIIERIRFLAEEKTLVSSNKRN